MNASKNTTTTAAVQKPLEWLRNADKDKPATLARVILRDGTVVIGYVARQESGTPFQAQSNYQVFAAQEWLRDTNFREETWRWFGKELVATAPTTCRHSPHMSRPDARSNGHNHGGSRSC